MQSTKWSVAALLVLSPLIGEYLLGSLPMSMIGLLPLMMAMYGAAAILIREIARSRGGGWRSIVVLAMAYGLLEEGFITQSLFNPDYLHLRLLDFGTALPWALFVVSIHVVWSIVVPIALTESAFPARRDQPWLGMTGRVLYSLLFVLGCALIAAFSYKQSRFMATPAQFAVVGALIIGLCGAASTLARRSVTTAAKPPGVNVLFLASFVAGSVFMLLSRKGESTWHLGATLAVALMLGIEAVLVAFVWRQTRGGAWDERRRFAFMAGAFMVYVWIGFLTDISLHGQSDIIAHSVLAALAVGLLVLVGMRFGRHVPARTPTTSHG
jgi:hypothetical protein